MMDHVVEITAQHPRAVADSIRRLAIDTGAMMILAILAIVH
jgi:hypothetical protein